MLLLLLLLQVLLIELRAAAESVELREGELAARHRHLRAVAVRRLLLLVLVTPLVCFTLLLLA